MSRLTATTRVPRWACVVTLAVLATSACSSPGTDAGSAPAAQESSGGGAEHSGGGADADPGATSDGALSDSDNSSPTTGDSPDRPRRRFTLAGSGDILPHNLVNQDTRANGGGTTYDYNPMFDDVRGIISSADWAICHLETPLSTDNTDLTRPRIKVFNTPHEMAPALKNAGWDACDTAGNHTWDKALTGIRQTNEVMDQAGLGHAGGARDQAEMDSPPIYDVKGVKVGHLAYSYTIPNAGEPNTVVPSQAPWLRDMLWPALGFEGIVAQARALRARGAEVVVLSMHWGAEYQHQPTGQQRTLAAQLLGSPEVDLILGDHVHVIQPCEKINDKYVIYGMGNFLSNQSPQQDSTLKPATQDGSIHTFTFDEVAPGRFRASRYEYTPTFVVMQPRRHVVPAQPPVHKASYDRTVTNVGLLGAGACDAKPAF